MNNENGSLRNRRPSKEGNVSVFARRPRATKLVLALGYVAIGIGMLGARFTPAQTFELSIYAGTPLVYWFGFGFAMLVAMGVTFTPDLSDHLHYSGFLLGGIASVSFVSLPVLRGYFFRGPGDSLTHLGWTREIANGTLNPFELLYPGTHVATVVMSLVTGTPLERSSQYVVIAFAVVFLLFIPLCVKVLYPSPLAAPAGLFAALMFLPVNNVSTFHMFHPTTQAIMVTPMVLWLLFRTLPGGGGESVVSHQTYPLVLLLGIISVSYFFVHPQQGLNLFVVFLSVFGLQMLVRARWSTHRIANHRVLLVPTIALGALLAIWLPQHQRATGAADGIIDALVQLWTGQGVSPVDGASARGQSLNQIGGSLGEMFVKLFLASAVFVLLSGILVAIHVRFRESDLSDRDSYVSYLTVASVASFTAFVLYLLSSVTTQYYRQIGFLMVIGTILGAVALLRGVTILGDRLSKRTALVGLGVVLVVLLALSLPSFYRSPYIYQPSDHVSESQLEGFSTVFEMDDRSVGYVGIRQGPGRYADALFGANLADKQTVIVSRGAVPPDVFRSQTIATHYREPTYLVVTERDEVRESEVYGGLRYDDSGFRSLSSQSGLSRVYTNGEVRLYYIAGTDSQ